MSLTIGNAYKNEALQLKGQVFFGLWNPDGTVGALRPVGNTLNLEISDPKIEEISVQSTMRDDYGAKIANIIIGTTRTLGFKLTDFSPENLRAALFGEITAVTQVSGSVTGETVAAAKGACVKLAKKNILSDPAPVVVDATDPLIVMEEGVDYLVEWQGGMLMALAGSASITEGQELLVNYSYGARTGTRVEAGRVDKFEVRLVLLGINLATQERVELNIPKLALKPKGGISMIDKKFADLGFEGEMITIGGEAAFSLETVVDGV
jgi:hypothetical protein